MLEARGITFDVSYRYIESIELAIAFFTDPSGVHIELTEGFDEYKAQSLSRAPVRFRAHDISEIRGGYAVAMADFNNDGWLDVIANSLGVPEVAWHENPTWERHVIVAGKPSIVNQAMADLDDDGELELVNVPLIGPGSLAPTYDQDRASVLWYGQDGWRRHTIADDIPGIIHRVRPVRWDPGSRDQVLVASFDGVAFYRATGTGDAMTFQKELISHGHVEAAAPRLGAGDVGTGMSDGRRIVASVEPWHGNGVVVYTESGGPWRRRVIFDEVTSGHEIAVLDVNGDGRVDIVANDNSRPTENNPNATPDVHVFFSPDDPATGEWTYSRIESETAMNSCVDGDMNQDGRPDLVWTGRGGMIRWYENLGAGSGRPGGRARHAHTPPR